MQTDSKARVLYPSIALFLMTAGFIITKTARDALYFQEDGLLALPIAYIAIAALSVPQAMVILSLIHRVGPRTTRTIAPILVVIMTASYALVAEPGRGFLQTGFFVFVPLVFSIVFSLTWLLTSELLQGEPEEVLRSGFARVAAASMLGGTLGSAAARLLGEVLEPQSLLMVGALMVFLSTISVVLAHRRFEEPSKESSSGEPAAERTRGIKDVLQMPYTPALLGIGIAAALAAILVDFLFYFEASSRAMSGKEMAQFFANVYFVLNFAALFIQIVVTPRIQKLAGIAGTLAVLPLSLLGGALTLAGGGAVFGRSLLRITEGGLKSSVHRSSWEQAYLSYDHELRPMAKVFVDGIGARIAEGLAAVGLLVWIDARVARSGFGEDSTYWISIAILLVTATWIALTAQLRSRLKESPAETYDPTPLPDF